MNLESNNNKSFAEIIDSDDTLFHYTKRSTALEMILPKNSFKLFRLLDTNDPREYKNRLLGVVGWDWKEATEILIHQASKCADALLRNNSFFASFSENRYDNNKLYSNGYLKPRMWGQYGEDHYGVCLVFSKQLLINTIHDSIVQNEFVLFHNAISYKTSEKYPQSQTLSINGDSFDNSSPFQIAFEHIRKHNYELFFKKDPDYKDEDEYRFVLCRSKEDSLELQSINIQLDKCLRGMILGDRFPKVYRPTVEKLCEDLRLEYKTLHWEKWRYLLLNGL